MQRPLSWRGWRTKPWVKRLYGTICDPSTADRGAAGFISSLPAIPVSPSAGPESGEGRLIPATCGPRSPESCGMSNPGSSSLRTSRDTSPWALGTSPESFRAWDTASRRACSRRLRRARLTQGSGCSFWPTPTASDAGYFPDLLLEAGQADLKGPFDVTKGSGGQFSLSNAARVWTMLWLALGALGAMPGTTRSLSLRRVRVSFRSGDGSSLADLISNPRFQELSMGWPIDWTAPEASVTGFARWLQRSRGALSEILADQV